MPFVFRGITTANQPDFGKLTGMQSVTVSVGDTYDAHHDDCDTYWLIAEGDAIIRVSDIQLTVGPGDIVRTPARTLHDILAVRGKLRMFLVQVETELGGYVAYQHGTEEQAAGHPIQPIPFG